MLRSAVAIALLVSLMGLTGVREANAGGFVIVDTPADFTLAGIGCVDGIQDGDCPLRDAIVLANAGSGTTAIVFSLGSGVPTIQPTSPLPDITAPVFMDGATGGATRINLYGASALGSDGLRLVNHSGSTIKNMVINGWSDGSGIALLGGGTHMIEGNLIGTNHLGTTAFPNLNGIYMQDSTNNTIGGDASSDTNVISGNISMGVRLDSGANDNTVVGNTIGLSLDRITAIANNGSGIFIRGNSNQIGVPGSPNFIAGNVGHGVNITGVDNRVQGNLIGLNSQGQARPNTGSGVSIEMSTGLTNVIGGSLQDGNVISGNGSSGVFIDTPTNVDVSGNIIGLNPDGDAARPNGESGVTVVHTVGFAPDALPSGGGPTVVIGKPGAPNTISGNTGDGIVISRVDGVSVLANTIGVSANRDTGFANGLYGINVANADNTTIGFNFIAAHPAAGILIDGRLGDADGNEIENNFIGGIPDVAGNDVGIQVIANFTTILNNTIVRNNFEGITIAGNGNTIAGNSIGREGIGPAGNGADGAAVAGNNNRIGPLLTGQGDGPGGSGANAIWDNVGAGVVVEEGTGNTISQNSIGDNGGGGIDLFPLGITPNDTDDPDAGANDRQNFPVLTTANVLANGFDTVPQGGGSIVSGSLNSTPNADFLLEFFASESCSVGFPRSGEEYVGSAEVTTNSAGDVEFTIVVSPFLEQGEFVTATATSDLGSTGEFSACVVTGGPVTTPTPSPGPSASATPSSTPVEDMFGDADCDGDVDIDDFMAVMTEVADLPPGAPCSGNVGCEPPIDDQDALDILKYVASPADFPLPLC